MKAKRLAVEAIAAAATEGVERAQRARELSAAEVEEIGGAGGSTLFFDIRPYGGKLIKELAGGGMTTFPTQNQLDGNLAAGGLAGATRGF